MLGREISATLGLKFSLIDELLETLKRQHYVGVKKIPGNWKQLRHVFFLDPNPAAVLHAEYLEENNLYAGPAPVPLLYQYTEVVRRQKLRDNWLQSPAC